MKISTKTLTLSAMFLALALVLPFVTAQIPQIGSMLLPMHIPVLLCGFLCGWPLGLAVGFIAPLLRSLLFGMPPMPGVALPMAFELAAYGALTGLLYGFFHGIPHFGTMSEKARQAMIVVLALVIAMLLGRLVWGAAKYAVVSLFAAEVFTMPMFFAGAFVTAWPGIIVQLVLIPPIVLALNRLTPVKQ